MKTLITFLILFPVLAFGADDQARLKKLFETGKPIWRYYPSATNLYTGWVVFEVHESWEGKKHLTCTKEIKDSENTVYDCVDYQKPDTCPGIGCPDLGTNERVDLRKRAVKKAKKPRAELQVEDNTSSDSVK